MQYLKPALVTFTGQKSAISASNLVIVERLVHLTKLFPATFSDRFDEQMMGLLNDWLDVTAATPQSVATVRCSLIELEWLIDNDRLI